MGGRGDEREKRWEVEVMGGRKDEREREESGGRGDGREMR